MTIGIWDFDWRGISHPRLYDLAKRPGGVVLMRQPEQENVLDLGEGHLFSYFCWAPSDLPANRALYGEPLPYVERAGGTIEHLTPGNEVCLSAVHFDMPLIRQYFGERAVWQVLQDDPLTLSPSILCKRCGDHGFIRNGRWVKA